MYMKKELTGVLKYLIVKHNKRINTDTIDPEPIKKYDEYEIRSYINLNIISVETKDSNSAFRKLFDYIQGGNMENKKFEMTSPVLFMYEGNRIKMIFFLPLDSEKESLPNPTNPDVKLGTFEGKYVVMKYSWGTNDRNFKENKEKFKSIIEKNEDIIIEDKGCIKAIYNGPFTLPFLRRNEVMFKLNH